MGMFDRIYEDEESETSFQTKALGKTLGYYIVGSSASIKRSPSTAEDYRLYYDGRWDNKEFTGDCQFYATSTSDLENVLVTIRDGVIAELNSVRIESLPLFDSMGYPLTGK